MASEDVIELDSSDEETRPAKKIKTGANAMVHIPDSLHGVTIKPTKSSAGPKAKTTIVGNAIPLLNRNIVRTNGKKLQTVTKKIVNIRQDLHKGTQIAGKVNKTIGVNPVTLIKKLNSSQIMINKLPSNINVLKAPIPVMKGAINLPSSITVKKTSNLKRPATSSMGVKKKQKSNQNVREVLTIDSDDEEALKPQPGKPAGPQWYLRPEEQEALKKQVEKNNTEPDTSKYIEITIEDSPVKPVKDKRTCQVGTELAITIDDSPVKLKETSSSDKNKETGNTPHSKKKLEYPIETYEIEIEPMEVEESDVQHRDVQESEEDLLSDPGQTTEADKEHCSDNKDKEVNIEQQNEIIEVAGSPAKKKKDNQISELKEAPSKVIDLDLEDESTSSEFHPVYQQFIDLCLKIEDSVDMKTIVEKKIKSYYRQVPKEYTESEEFIDIVSGKILSMEAGPDKVYLYIKDIVDELNMQRKLAKQQVISKTKKKTQEEENFLYGEDVEFGLKRQRQIRKLEKTLKKLHRAIQKLEEQEVDFDDEEDSVYLLTERYKERMVRVHAKLCQLTNTKMPSEPRVQIDARPGQPCGPAKRLEKWVNNKKLPIGTPMPFPDFHDVLRCVREANEEDKLGWNDADVMEEARDLFVRCGKKLQRRRQENEWRLAASRISVDVDPAEANEGLKKKLEENRQLATKKETDVFNKYADRQSMLMLEAELVGDKEAEESPVESEEEETVDDSCAMKNKERRKERLRRLIQEKPKNSDRDYSPQKELDINTEGVIDNINDASNVEKGNEKSETETKLQEESIDENKVEPKKVEKIHSISDSSDNVGSDVDELHLLQKLHSGNEVDSSTTDSSGSLIDISDTIQSDNENNDKIQGDNVISIENSSYSDSERSNDAKIDAMESSATTTESQADSVRKEPGAEQILLIGSDEDKPSKEDSESQGSDVACMNKQDDAISIGETQVQGMENTTATKKINYKDDELLEIAPSSAILKTPPHCLENRDAEQVILTGSDENRTSKEDNESLGSDVVCLNTQDDAFSIGHIEGIKNTTTKNSNKMDTISKTETSKKNPCFEKENNINKLLEMAPSSAILKKTPNADSNLKNVDLPIVTQVTATKVTDDLNKDSDKIGKNEDKESRVSTESNLSFEEDEIVKVGSQHADLSNTEKVIGEKVDDKDSDKNRKIEDDKESRVINKSQLSLKEDETVFGKVGSQDADTETKLNEKQVLIKESDEIGRNKDENDSRKSNLRLKEDEIVLNEVGSQDAKLPQTEICKKDEKSLNNDYSDTITNKDSSCTEIGELIEQSFVGNDTEPLSSKVADVSEEIFANDEKKSKKDTVQSDERALSALISDDNYQKSGGEQTETLEHMLEELRSDLNANE